MLNNNNKTAMQSAEKPWYLWNASQEKLNFEALGEINTQCI